MEKKLANSEDMEILEQILAELPDGPVRDYISANKEDVAEMLVEEYVEQMAIRRMNQEKET